MKKVIAFMMALTVGTVAFAQTEEIVPEDPINSNYVDLETMDCNGDGVLDILRLQSNGRVTCHIRNANTEEGLIAHWTFDDSNNLGDDVTPNNHDGTLRTGTGNLPIHNSTGKVNGAVEFTSADHSYIDITSTSTNFDFDGDFTISLWINMDASSSSTQEILTRESSKWPDLSVLPDGKLQTYVINGSTASLMTSTNPVIVAGNWYHIVISRNNTTQKMYVNNTLIKSAESSGTFTGDGNSIFIGDNWSAHIWWDGLIDDLRIYSRALSDTDICTLYELGGETCL